MILCQPLAYSAAACALPDDGVPYGSARRAIPGERRLTLVADPDGSDFFACQMLLFEHFSDKCLEILPDFFWIVLDPAALINDLRVCAVEPRGNGSVKAQQEQLRSLRALIDGENEVRHLR